MDVGKSARREGWTLTDNPPRACFESSSALASACTFFSKTTPLAASLAWAAASRSSMLCFVEEVGVVVVVAGSCRFSFLHHFGDTCSCIGNVFGSRTFYGC